MYKKLRGGTFGARLYDASVEVNPHLGSATQLFASNYFSAILDLTEKGGGTFLNLARETIRLYLGALAQKLSVDLNDELIKKSPAGARVFDEIGGVFNIDVASAGQAAFESVMKGSVTWKKGDGDELFFPALLSAILEEVVSRFFSYQALVDEMYPNLFTPHDWAKFSKISIFLHSVHEYILEKQAAILSGPFMSATGYYQDIRKLAASKRFEICALGTSNYTSLLETALSGVHHPTIAALNGSLGGIHQNRYNDCDDANSEEFRNSRYKHKSTLQVRGRYSGIVTTD